MQKYALIGHPLTHSISPFIHSLLFEIDGVDAEYSLIDIPIEKLKQNIEQLESLDGYNITIPLKTEITKYITSLSRNSFLSNSVNNVHNVYGKPYGYTTDAEAFSLIAEREKFNIKGDVVILGCGGAARAVALSCIGNESKSITLAIREQSRKKAEALVDEFRIKLNYEIKICDIKNIDTNIDILVNATPVGMYPNANECPIDDETIKKAKSVFDTIYNPIKTVLVKKAESFNIKAIGGIEMLVYQAALSHTCWLDSYYTDEQLEEIIRLAALEVKRIYG